MTQLRSLLRAGRRLFADRRGATAVEYGLICALIVLAMIGALGGVADQTATMWNNVSDKVVRAR